MLFPVAEFFLTRLKDELNADGKDRTIPAMLLAHGASLASVAPVAFLLSFPLGFTPPFLVVRNLPALFRRLPGYRWIGGALGSVNLFGAIVAIPKIG